MKKILWTLAPTLFAASFLTHAQDAAHVAMPPANLKPMVDRFGIDMTSGTTGIGGMAIAIGSAASSIVSDPGRTRYLQDNHTSTLTEITVKRTGADNETPSFAKGLPIGTFISVQSAGRMEVFQLSGSSYLNYRGTGGTLSCTTTTCTYTDKEGYISVFDKAKAMVLNLQRQA